MNESGRKVEVIVEVKSYEDQRTGVMIPSRSLTVWADERMKKVISGIEGVTSVYNSICKTQFDVFLDARYDVNFVAKEIETQILKASEL